MDTEAEELIPTRQSLLSRLKNWDDQASWNEFFETYWKLIYHMAVKSGLTDAEAQDVVQETVISVSKNLPRFQYDPAVGDFKSWLLKLTYWRITDQLRKRIPVRQPAAANDDGTPRTSTVERIPDAGADGLEALWEDEWQKNLMDAAIQRVKRRVDAKHYQLFDLYVLKHWPLLKVCKVLKVSAGRVYLAKHRIGNLIKKEVRHLETKTV